MIDYEYLRDKAVCEIYKLMCSEADGEMREATDCALNAAFTIYHLLEWKERDENPDSKMKAHELIAVCDNEGIRILHDLITYAKHARVSHRQSDNWQNEETKWLSVQYSNLYHIPGTRYLDRVYFGNKLAMWVLNEAFRAFEPDWTSFTGRAAVERLRSIHSSRE